MRFGVAALPLLLCSCATPEAVPVLHTVCLPLVAYSAADQAQSASELQRLGPHSKVAQMMTDYGAMRAAARACQESK